ncbi:replicative DNA helicase [Actinomadura sp. NTSP31]|uniref:replicative DNA helicase n=1 Tax=Actinomadura sp. NTSP31 TaxID=1735447 RepID=UPI0035C1BF90
MTEQLVDGLSDPSDFRPPRHDLAAEKGVLAGMMLAQDMIADVVETGLRTKHFFRPGHQLIYNAILDLYGRGDPTDVITVAGELDKRGELMKVGEGSDRGGSYLHTLVSTVPVGHSASHYARTVETWGRLALLEQAGTRIVQIARSVTDADDAADLANKTLEEATRDTTSTTARPVSELISGYLDHLENGSGDTCLATGWNELDSLLGGGLRPGQMVVIGARPGIGKSVVMLNAAYNAAISNGLPVLFASLEMSHQELMDRIVSRAAKISLHRLRTRSLDKDDWDRFAKVMPELGIGRTLLLDDDPGTGITQLRTKLRAMRRAGAPAALLVVDYLQLMTAGKRTENRQIEVSMLARSLKLLAKEFAVPVVVGSQLNRGVENRNDKKPLLADLRESGAVEQDSDIVILLHREDAYDKESPRSGEIDLIVAKHRNGPTATVTLAWQGHYQRASNLGHEPGPAYTQGAL